MTRIIITGSGSACGVPSVGGGWGGSDAGNPKNVRTRSAASFETPEGDFLVECGPDFRTQTWRHNITSIDNIFLSHGHADHIISIWELSGYAAARGKPVNIYGSRQTLDEVKRIFSFMFAEGKPRRVILNEIEAFAEFTFSGTKVTITPLPFVHQNMNPLGFKYKKTVYTPDFCSFPDTTGDYLKNLDLWIMELTTRNDIGRGHNCLDRLYALLEKYQPKKCVLNHLSSDIDYETLSVSLPANVELAYDGMVIDLP